VTIVGTPLVTGGVDTHADMHVAAALDTIGGLLGVSGLPAAPAGYARLRDWLGSFGMVALVGVEGTGGYGAGLARYLDAAGIRVVEAGPRRPAGPAPPGQALACWMRSAPPAPRSRAAPAAPRGAATARSRRSAR